MMNSNCLFVLLLLCFVIFCNSSKVPVYSSATNSKTTLNSHARSIHFESGSIDTSNHPEHKFVTQSVSADSLDSSVKHHYLIHYAPPLTGQLRNQIESILELPLTHYYPSNTYLVYTTLDKITALKASVEQVLWVGEYEPQHKLHSSININIEQEDTNQQQDEDDEDHSPLTIPEINVVLGSGHSVSDTQSLASEYESEIKNEFNIDINVAVLGAEKLHVKLTDEANVKPIAEFLSSKPAVHLIVRRPTIEVNNRWSRGLIQNGFNSVSYTREGNAKDLLSFQHNLKGSGQIVGIADTGIDVESCFFYDPEFPNGPPYKEYIPSYSSNSGIEYSDKADLAHRKVVQYVKFYDTNHLRDTHGHGHGTHTAGSVAGNAYTGHSTFNGMAPEAKLAVFDMGPALSRLPDPLDINMLPWAYAAGARIHTNSWTSKADFSYSSQSQEIDNFMWVNKDMLVLYSASNHGLKPLGQQLPAPATNKNGIAVGASMSTTQHWKEITGTNGLEPNPDHYLLVESEPLLFSPESLACFSSRGPTKDGRIKPDIIAPGFYIVSAKNQQEASTSCSNDPDSLLRALPGTSQATPTVAGLAALVREYFVEGYYPPTQVGPIKSNGFNPSAALVKAIIIASGKRITGRLDSTCAVLSKYNLNPQLVDLDETFPNSQQGFGRVELSNSLVFFGDESNTIIHRPSDKSAVDILGDPYFNPGDKPIELDYCYEGSLESSQPSKVTLVWTDMPGQPNSAISLVNDLDLVVIDQSTGAKYYGNGNQDRSNTVEQVLIDQTLFNAATTIRVEVIPHSLQAQQPYALILTGRFKQGACAGDFNSLSSIPIITDISSNTVKLTGGIVNLVSVSFSSLGNHFQAIATGIHNGETHIITGTQSPIAFTDLTPGEYSITIINLSDDGKNIHSKPVITNVEPMQDSSDNNNPNELIVSHTTEITGIADSIVEVNSLTHHHITVSFVIGSSVKSLSAAFELSTEDGEYHIIGNKSPLTLTRLPAGEYTFIIRTLDASGNSIATSKPSHIIQLLPSSGSLYSWNFSPWSICSSPCGTGTQTRSVFCESAKHGVVAKRYCEKLITAGAEPSSTQTCNTELCGALNFEWQISSWTPCSKSCNGGIHKREVYCATINTKIPMPEQYCADAPKPISESPCNLHKCSTESAANIENTNSLIGYFYSIGSCNSCNGDCVQATCERSVQCMIGSLEVDDQTCIAAGLSKPPTKVQCIKPSCNSLSSTVYPPIKYSWRATMWSACSTGCGGGVQHRYVKCWSSEGHFEHDEKCSHQERPNEIHQCNMDPCPTNAVAPLYQWLLSPYTPCSVPSMEKHRWVVCADTAGIHHPANKCEAHVGPRPNKTAPCTESEKLEALALAHKAHPVDDITVEWHWVSGIFGAKSHWCKTVSDQVAIRTRRAFCIGSNGIVADYRFKKCQPSSMPQETREVSLEFCPYGNSWQSGSWSVCNNQDPCKGTEYRQTVCVDETGGVISDKGACVRAGLEQPSNQRSPCGSCTTQPPVDISHVPVYGLEQDAQVLYDDYTQEFKENSAATANSLSALNLDSKDCVWSFDHENYKLSPATKASAANNGLTNTANRSSSYSFLSFISIIISLFVCLF